MLYMAGNYPESLYVFKGQFGQLRYPGVPFVGFMELVGRDAPYFGFVYAFAKLFKLFGGGIIFQLFNTAHGYDAEFRVNVEAVYCKQYVGNPLALFGRGGGYYKYGSFLKGKQVIVGSNFGYRQGP